MSGPDLVDLVDAHLRQLFPAVRHREAEDFQLRHEKRSPRACGGWDALDWVVSVNSGLVDNINDTLPARHINEFIPGIKKQIICVTGNGHTCNQSAAGRGGIENEQLGWVATSRKEPVIGLIQNQREVGFGLLERPD